MVNLSGIGEVPGWLALTVIIFRETMGYLRRRNKVAEEKIDWSERDLHIKNIIREELDKFMEREERSKK